MGVNTCTGDMLRRTGAMRRIPLPLYSHLYSHLYLHCMLYLCILLTLLRVGEARPSGDQGQGVPQLKDPFSSNTISRLDPAGQLHKYGFYGANRKEGANNMKADKASITEPLKQFQKFYGLNQTGVLDNATLTLMGNPRCGLPDVLNSSSSLSHRHRRYALIARWRFHALTYRVGPTSKMAQNVLERVIARAFRLWGDASALTFTKVSRDPIIDISFHRGNHGDRDSFDGQGGVLAHAYFPQAGGAVHLDEDENWTEGSYLGVNLFQIIAHELGHSLGLAHSRDRNALMYAYYKGYNPYSTLGADDIAGIQRLYGPPETVPTPRPQPPTPWPQTPRPQTPRPQTPRPQTPRPQTPRPQTPRPQTPRPPTQRPPTQRPFTQRPDPFPPNPTPFPEACPGKGKFDAIFSINNNTYAIEGMQFYMLNDEAVEVGYPIHVHEALGNNIKWVDTALVVTENRAEVLYLFEGTDVWKYDRLLRPYSSTPWSIGSIFKGLNTNIDSAFYSEVYRAIYFFKDGGYYRCSSNVGSPNSYPIDPGYPLANVVWNLNVQRVDAVFTWVKNRRVYIFSDNQYYRYDERRLQVDLSIIPYPRDVKKWWLGCSNPQNLVAEIRHENSSTNYTDKVIYHEKPSDDWKTATENKPFDPFLPPSPKDSIPEEGAENRVLSDGIFFENEDSVPDLPVSLGVCIRGQYLWRLMTLCLVLCWSVLLS